MHKHNFKCKMMNGKMTFIAETLRSLKLDISRHKQLVLAEGLAHVAVDTSNMLEVPLH